MKWSRGCYIIKGDDPQITKDYILCFSEYFLKEPKSDKYHKIILGIYILLRDKLLMEN